MLPENPQGGRFTGRQDFERLVRDALAKAAREGWQDMIWSDASFEDWPLRERAVVDSLQAWASAGRRLTLLAARYDQVLRNQPRFVTWRRTWGHLVDCRVVRDVAPADFPSALWSRNWYMQRLDVTYGHGTWGEDRLSLIRVRELLDEKNRNSSPGFSASVLGL
jgi:hypothetical protein